MVMGSWLSIRKADVTHWHRLPKTPPFSAICNNYKSVSLLLKPYVLSLVIVNVVPIPWCPGTR